MAREDAANIHAFCVLSSINELPLLVPLLLLLLLLSPCADCTGLGFPLVGFGEGPDVPGTCAVGVRVGVSVAGSTVDDDSVGGCVSVAIAGCSVLLDDVDADTGEDEGALVLVVADDGIGVAVPTTSGSIVEFFTGCSADDS